MLSVGVLVARCTPEVSTPEGGVSPTLVPSPTAYSPTPTPHPTPTPTPAPSIPTDLSLPDLLSSSLVYIDGQWELGCDDGGCALPDSGEWSFSPESLTTLRYPGAIPGTNEQTMHTNEWVNGTLSINGQEYEVLLPLGYFDDGIENLDSTEEEVALPAVNDFSTWLGTTVGRIPFRPVGEPDIVYSYRAGTWDDREEKLEYVSLGQYDGQVFAHFILPNGIAGTPLEGKRLVYVTVDDEGNENDTAGFILAENVPADVAASLPVFDDDPRTEEPGDGCFAHNEVRELGQLFL